MAKPNIRTLTPPATALCALFAGTGVFRATAEDATMGCKGAGSASGASGTSMLEEAAVCGCAVEEDDGQVLDMATLSMCTRYAQLAIDIENPPLNTSFVLQWMLHARLRERQALLQVTQPTPLTPPQQ